MAECEEVLLFNDVEEWEAAVAVIMKENQKSSSTFSSTIGCERWLIGFPFSTFDVSARSPGKILNA